MVRYVAVIVTALAGLVAIGIVAKLGVLGGWSALVYVVASVVLVVVVVVALFLGTRRDARQDRSGTDNDY